jgi:uncharacterized membrane protein YGL010W
MENIHQTNSTRDRGLLDWQFAEYDRAHHDRRNLALHVATVPVFLAGTLTALAAPVVSVWLLPVGLGAMAVAMIAQGKGHALEAEAPAPFAGPLDVVARIFAEQWITFPRFVLSGGFARAWREAG